MYRRIIKFIINLIFIPIQFYCDIMPYTHLQYLKTQRNYVALENKRKKTKEKDENIAKFNANIKQIQ